MRTARPFPRNLPRPILLGSALACSVFLLTHQYPALQALLEPGDLISTGLTGFWAVRWAPLTAWRMEFLAAVLAAVLVILLRLALAAVLGALPHESAGLDVARAALSGITGAILARLLNQRISL